MATEVKYKGKPVVATLGRTRLDTGGSRLQVGFRREEYQGSDVLWYKQIMAYSIG